MSKKDFEHSLVSGKPYFGPYMASSRSWPYIYWYQQKLIKFLSEQNRLESIRILEIGSAGGGSAYSWAEAITRYFNRQGQISCVDIWEYIDLDEIGPEFEVGSSVLSIFLHNISAANFEDIIDYAHMTSDEAFKSKAGEYFDVIYLDGDHTYEQVKRDIENSFESLAPGGILCGDDLEFQLIESNKELIMEATEKGDDWTIDPLEDTGFHPGVSRAVYECLEQVSSWHGFWAVQKVGSLFQNIDLESIEAKIPRALMQYDYDGNKVLNI